jgi:DNA-binding transcriptional LysR family regulator
VEKAMSFRHMRVWRYLDEVSRSGSIRKAAERLSVTPSAVQRRVQDIEQDLGTPIFERSKQGMRLTSAGEIFVHWVRTQASDLERVQSQIEDLSGLRRGHVRLACSQALVHSFLPSELARFSAQFPLVTFHVEVCDHDAAQRSLVDFDVDLVLIFTHEHAAELQPLMTVRQRLVALMAPGHPLAAKPTLRLRDCTAFPIAIGDRNFGTRQIIAGLLAGSSTRLDVRLESNSFELLRNFVRHNDAVAFHIEIGAHATGEAEPLEARPIEDRDIVRGSLVLGQLRGRALSVAAAKFGEFLAQRLDAIRRQPPAAETTAARPLERMPS